MRVAFCRPVLRPFRARWLLGYALPGLKPWAEIFRPFGTRRPAALQTYEPSFTGYAFPGLKRWAGVWTFSCACSNRPKGEQRTAQGFSPGSATHKEIALKGRPNRHWQKHIEMLLSSYSRDFRTGPVQLAVAILLDLLLGDPRGWPHIAKFTGRLSEWYEAQLTNRAPRTAALGIVFWFCVIGTLLAAYLLVRRFCLFIGPAMVLVLDSIVIYQAIAARDLHEHAEAVLKPLIRHDLAAARKQLSWLVGRDTQSLDEGEISRATIESVAENLTDGIIAPLFWSLVGGAPGALVYRAANTLDSMVGHRTAAYERFGKASARIDDLLNWVPARICAMLFCLFGHKDPETIRFEAAAHASPNAGWGESAMAHVLGVRLGGDNYYDGELVQGPLFNRSGRPPSVTDIRKSLNWMWAISGAAIGVFLLATALTRKNLALEQATRSLRVRKSL
jgi:adenosylcobinamide-phosphate synthase